MPTNLVYRNQSNDVNNSSIVIFQKNVAVNLGEMAVAWIVIENCAIGNHHPFTYTYDLEISAADSYGNFTPQIAADNGNRYQMYLSSSGNSLGLEGKGTSVSEVQLINNLPQGAITANIYWSGKLLATKTAIAPQQLAAFEFKPIIFVGVVSQVVEGKEMDSAILSSTNAQFSLLGIQSADLVLSGGVAVRDPRRTSSALKT